jgi:hypothetical protein
MSDPEQEAASAEKASAEARLVRAWAERKPGQLIGMGHPAGDFLEAHAWTMIEEREVELDRPLGDA